MELHLKGRVEGREEESNGMGLEMEGMGQERGSEEVRGKWGGTGTIREGERECRKEKETRWRRWRRKGGK